MQTVFDTLCRLSYTPGCWLLLYFRLLPQGILEWQTTRVQENKAQEGSREQRPFAYPYGNLPPILRSHWVGVGRAPLFGSAIGTWCDQWLPLPATAAVSTATTAGASSTTTADAPRSGTDLSVRTGCNCDVWFYKFNTRSRSTLAEWCLGER